MLQPNSFVRIIDGEHANKVGFVSEVHDLDDTFSIIVVDSEDYHRPRVPRQYLMGARFVGGATCVCFIRDSIANLCRIAVMGDTRCLVVNGPECLEKEPVFEQLPDSKSTFLTFPHDVYNTAELARLQAEWDGEHEIDGCYLVNPLTGCEIQPTRGFGDFDMFGTGYISQPDISMAFPMEPNTIVVLGSDGLFDSAAWKDDFQYMADFLATHAKEVGVDIASLGEMLHLESVRRSELISNYVDDLSFFMCRCVPRPLDFVKRNSSHHAGVQRQSMTTLGVEGLPNYTFTAAATAAATSTGGGSSFILPRLSASLSEIAVNRRISHAMTNHTILDIDFMLPQMSMTTPPATPKQSKQMKRHSTADFINPNAPRYIKHSMMSKEDTIRRTRGPSFMLPDGFDCTGSTSQAGEDDQSCGGGDIAMDLARIGEDVEYTDGNSPADTIRHMIAHKRKSVNPELFKSSTALHRSSVNTILQRMAARYGHDPRVLQEIAKDLNMV